MFRFRLAYSGARVYLILQPEFELREKQMPQNEEKRLDIASLIGEATAYDKKQALEEKRPKS